MDRPIYNTLKNLSNKKIYPFHMPGHKRNKKFLNDFYDFIDLDFTEAQTYLSMYMEYVDYLSKWVLEVGGGSNA